MKIVNFMTLVSMACLFSMLTSCANDQKMSSEDFPDPGLVIHFELTKHRNRETIDLDLIFGSLEARLMHPGVLGGERDASIDRLIPDLLNAVGDQDFASHLSKHEPRVRSAVAEFVNLDELQYKFPQTWNVLARVPQITWPASPDEMY